MDEASGDLAAGSMSHETARMGFMHLVQVWKGSTKLMLSPSRIEKVVLHINSCESCKEWRKKVPIPI